MKKLILLLFLTTILGMIGHGQVAQFPQVYYNGQGSGGANLYIHQSASYSSPNITLLSTTSNIGAVSLVTNSGDQYFMNWIQVCLPSTTGGITYGYMPCDEFYARINEVNNYATVTTTTLNIRTGAGTTFPNVTIGGANATFGNNSIVALTGNSSNVSGVIWYQVHLTMNCSQVTGWVSSGTSATLLSVNSNTTNYRNAGGRICTDANSCNYLGSINGATINITGIGTTYSSGGFYQYKLPINYSCTITCIYSGYNTTSPTLYPYTATNHNYSLNFVLSNTSCGYSISPNSNINVPVGGVGNLSVLVTAQSGCAWSSNNNGYTWITATSSGTGSGKALYSVAQNPGSSSRTGIIIIAGQSFTITQAGGSCTYTINPISNNSVPASGVSNLSVSVTTQSGCTWYSSNNGNAWITVNSSGTGSGTALYSVAQNQSSSSRTGTITIAGQNFTITQAGASSSGIIISSSVIPPWQREGDSFNGSITVDLSNAGSNPHWHIEADAFNETGSYAGPINIGMGTTSNTISFTSSQLTSSIHQGWHFNWNAVLESNNSFVTAGQETNIIESKWLSKNVWYYNNPNSGLNIPLKYIQGTTSISYRFSRVSLTSTAQTDPNDNIETISTSQLTGNTHEYISESYISPNSNIEYVTPGVFNFQITYYPSGTNENGQFDLTKFGNVNSVLGGTNFDPNKIVVLIGGINNTVEKDIRNLANASNQTNAEWSIANDMVFGSPNPHYNGKNYNTWYIATCNIQSIQKNAYDIGNSLQNILGVVRQPPFNATNPDLNIIAHSKGGLEIRIMLSNNGIPLFGAEGNFNNNSSYFDCGPLSPYLHSINFLGSPHKGASSAYFEFIPEWNLIFNYAVGATDLRPGSGVINFLAKGTAIPNGFNLRIGNITGYGDYLGGDGCVSKSSSENPNISNVALHQYYINDDNGFPFHIYLYRSLTLNDPQHTCEYDVSLPYYHTVFGTVSLMDRITAIINDLNIQSSCPDPNVIQMSAGTFGSVISNATISIYSQNQNYTAIAKTDENGFANFHLYDVIPYGDTILINAPGIESMKFRIDSSIIKTRSFRIPMFHVQNSLNLSEPAITLLNENPITANHVIQLKLTAQNINQYFINFPYSQDSLFIPLAVNTEHIASITLDTGVNILHIKFVGTLSDTADIIKTVYYFPDSLMSFFTSTQTINADNSAIGAKMFVDNNFYNSILSSLDTMPLIPGDHDLKFTKFGYQDSVYHIDSISAINVRLKPINYSSISDSSIIDFAFGYKTNYWKTLSFLDSSRQSTISVKQYDDNFSGMGLIPKSRKFEMRHLNSNWSGIRFASVLDQIENLSTDSIYLMRVYNDTSFTKILFDTNGIVAGYDSAVQKLTYNYINFNNGAAAKEALVIMKKQAPIVRNVSSMSINENDSLNIPLSQFFSDPDSIHNDITFQIQNPNPAGLHLSISNGNLVINANLCYSGNTSFNIQATHDGLSANNSINIHVIPPAAPNVTIMATTSANNICAGKTVTFSSVVANAGTPSVYQWYLNGAPIGLNSSTFTTTPLNSNSKVYCMITPGLVCPVPATSNTVNISVIPNVTPAITISQTSCEGTTVMFNSTITNGGNTPLYLWTVNGSATGNYSDPAFTLNNSKNGDNVQCTLTSDATCVTEYRVVSLPLDIDCVLNPVNNVNGLESFSIIPNPNNGDFIVKFKLTTDKNISFILLNYVGQVVYVLSAGHLSGIQAIRISKAQLQSGVYLLKMMLDKESFISKVEIAH